MNIDELLDHSHLHSSLAFFGFAELENVTVDALNSKRADNLKYLLNKYLLKLPLESEFSRTAEWRTKFQQLNDHYENLKSHITNRFEINRFIRHRCQKFRDSGKSCLCVYFNL